MLETFLVLCVRNAINENSNQYLNTLRHISEYVRTYLLSDVIGTTQLQMGKSYPNETAQLLN